MIIEQPASLVKSEIFNKLLKEQAQCRSVGGANAGPVSGLWHRLPHWMTVGILCPLILTCLILTDIKSSAANKQTHFSEVCFILFYYFHYAENTSVFIC